MKAVIGARGSFLIVLLLLLLSAGWASPARAATFPCAIDSSDIAGLTFVNPQGTSSDGNSYALGGVLTSANISATTGDCNTLQNASIRPLVGATPTATINLPVASATAQGGWLIRFASNEVRYLPPSHSFSGTDTFTIDNNNNTRVITVTVNVLPAGPSVTSLSPASGPAAGGTSVVLTGVSLSGATAVMFGGTPATGYTVNSATQITATAPAGTGTVNVQVTTADGTSPTGAGNQFTYVAAPTVTSLSPTTGPAGGGNTVVITGTGFSTATAVTFGATAATGFTVNSGTQITATAPAGTGTVNVRVTATGGTSATGAGNQFTYVPAPVVTSISPTAGPVTGGTSVVITGTGFSGATAVVFGGTAATGFTVNSATQITATSPAGTGTVDVRVTTVGGTSATSAADQFTFVPAPTVTAISPTAGPAGGGTTVTITGTGFSGTTAVTFGATPATGFTVLSGTSISATSPAGTGTVDVRVTTTGGTSATSAADQFTYLAAPTVTSLSPTSGPAAGGTSVVITGTGFSGATAVTFGASPASGFTVISGTQITATSPAGTGTVDVRVTTAGGTSATSAADQFTFIAAPTVTSLSPTAGPTTGGTTVTITGTNFTGATAVTFGASPASGVTVNSASQIVATSPAGTGTVDVRVTTPGGTSATSAADQFTYAAAPTVTNQSASTAYQTAVAIDLSAAITGISTSVTVASAPANGTTSVSGNVVTYTPSTGYAGPDSFTYTATGPGGTSAPATVTVTIGVPTITLAPASLTAPTYAAPYSASITASGGQAPYSFALTAGALPPGLTPNADGTLSGTPTATGTFNFTITATDSSTGPAAPFTGSQTYSVTIGTPTLTLIPPAGGLPGAVAGVAYSQTLSASGGIAPYSFSVPPGTLPAGLTLAPDGTLSGTPTAGGNFSFTVTATDSGVGGPFTASAAYTLAVTTPTVTIAPASLPAAMMEAAYSATLAASGGTAPYSYAVPPGALPAGLTLSPTGILSGTPTVHGSFTFTVTATDSSSGTGPYSGTQSYTLAVSPPLAPIANAVSANILYGSSANAIAPSLAGGTATSLALATQPAHGTASVSGLTISYTPTPGYAGPDSFTYSASNDGGTSAPATVTIAVTSPVVAVGPASLAAGQQDVPYSATLTATGGAAPYSFAVTAGALPAGLTLATNGTLAGTPSANGSFTFTVTATDASTGTGPFSAAIAYTLQIALPAAPVAHDAPGTTVPGTIVGGSSSVAIDLAALVSGNYSDIRIDTQPAHGTVTIASGFVATYRPAAGYQGPDAFTFVAVGPGGTSSPARAAISVVGAVPVARSLNATLLNGRELTLDITTGAAEAPFTNAAIVSIMPANALTAVLVAGGTPDNRSYSVKLRAIGRFSGSAVVSYTLSNVFGTSQPAAITVTVEARPDPSADPVVRGLSSAQAETTRRFASTQLDNFARRNEQLHGSGAGSRGRQVGIRVSGGDLAMDGRSGNDSVDEGGAGGRNDPGNAVDMRALRGVQVADATPGASPVLAQMAGAEASAAPVGERLPGSVEMWTGGALQIGTRDATTQRSKLRISSSGLSAGLDLKVNDSLTLGIGGGYGFDRTKVGEKDEGRLDAENWVGAIYGSLTPVEGMFVDGVFGIGGLDFDTRRLAPDGAKALGRRKGSMLFGSLATGFDKNSDRWRFSGYGRVEYMSARLKAYEETGAGIYNLAFAERKPQSFASILGGRAAVSVPSSIGLFAPRARIEWRHEFNRGGAQALDYADIAGADGLGYGYLIRDAGWLRDEFQIEIGTGLDISGGWSFGLDVGGRFGSGSTLGTAKVSASTKF